MKTAFEQIVNAKNIGACENCVSQSEIFSLAMSEKLKPARLDTEKTLLLVVDLQRDFLEGGALPVKGAMRDALNLSRFIYDNIENISSIAATCDTHTPMQIFHACWWKDAKGNPPAPFTIITKEAVMSGRFVAQAMPDESLKYLEALEHEGKKQLCIWPYHCLEESCGAALETQFLNMANFFAIARKAEFRKFHKGQIAFSEFYGALYPEYRAAGTENRELIDFVLNYDRIIIAGEAMDYCVYETTKQLCEELEKNDKSTRLCLLTNCTSSIGARDKAKAQYAELKQKYALEFI